MIYLDSAATTPIDDAVFLTYTSLLKDYFANPSSIHHLGRDAHFLLEKARKQCLALLGTPKHQLVFTSGATEANNLAIKGIAFAYQKRGKHLITSIGEHPSVLEPLYQLRDSFGFDLTVLPLDASGCISLNDLRNALRKDTILVSIMHVNNETGSIHPLKAIKDVLKTYPHVFFHSDVTQSIGKMPVPFPLLDAFTFSAHKIHGLKGSGALVVKNAITLLPLMAGGGQEFGLRSGTHHFAADVVLAKTLRLAFERLVRYQTHLEDLSRQLKAAFNQWPELTMNSPETAIPQIINVSLHKHKASVFVEALSSKKIYLASVAACSSKDQSYSRTVYAMTHDDDRAANTLRISLSHLNDAAEIDIFLKEFSALLKEIKPR